MLVEYINLLRSVECIHSLYFLIYSLCSLHYLNLLRSTVHYAGLFLFSEGRHCKVIYTCMEASLCHLIHLSTDYMTNTQSTRPFPLNPSLTV